MKNVTIRQAVLRDAADIREIYAYYVENTAISFEYEVPSVEEFERRMTHTLQRYPYLVAESGGRILGYAYAESFIWRPAYDWSCELTIYLDPDTRKQGLGRMLYGEIEKIVKKMGILNMYACIGWLDEDDEYVTKNSAQFHSHMGFKTVGMFRKCGRKFGRWYDMIYMEKIIGEYTDDQPDIRWFPELNINTEASE